MQLRNYTRLKSKIVNYEKIESIFEKFEAEMNIRKSHLIIITTGRLNGRNGYLAL